MSAIDTFNANIASMKAAFSNHTAAVDAHIVSKVAAVAKAQGLSEDVIQTAANDVAAVTEAINAETAKLNTSA